MNKGYKRSLSLVAIGVTTALLGGCASTHAIQAIHSQNEALLNKARGQAKPQPTVVYSKRNYVNPHQVHYVSGHGVSLSANNLPMNAALSSVLPKDWSLSYASGVKSSAGINLDLHHMTVKEAIQQIAMAGGYVAIINPGEQSVIISKHATFIFHVPTGLINRQSASLSVSSSNSVNSSGDSSGAGMGAGGAPSGMPSGGAAPGSIPGGSSSTSSGGQNGSSFSVSGDTASSKFLSAVKTLAGQKSVVSLDDSTGILSVTASAGGLERVTDYVRHYAALAETQINIHAAIIQVSLTKGLSTGIKWNRLLNAAGNLSLGLAAPIQSTASVISGGSSTSFNITATGTSFNGVINALQQHTKVNVLTEPELTTNNGVPATINSGTEIPYVGNLSNSVTGSVGTTTSGASLSYVNDGVSLSFVPEYLGSGYVQMAIVPALSNVEAMNTFKVSGGTMEGPVTQQDQTFVRLTAKSGETLILGGTMQSNGHQGRSGIPGLSKVPVIGALFGNYNQSSVKTQLVILVHVKVLPPPHINPLIGESL